MTTLTPILDQPAKTGPVTSPTIALQADAGEAVGFGHVGRCLAISDELGPAAVFITDDETIASEVKARGAGATGDAGYASIVVLDRSLPTSSAQVERLQAAGKRVCLVDDPGSGRRVADLVIDPPTGHAWAPSGGLRLGGFDHVLLRRDILEAAAETPGSIQILLALGGSDPGGLTVPIARSLTDAGLSVVSVIGPGYQGDKPRGTVLDNSDEWPSALATADLLITGFGHTLLEAAYLGTPVLSLPSKPQSVTDAVAFSAHGTAVVNPLIDGGILGVSDRAAALLDGEAELSIMSSAGRKLVDGLGAARVAQALKDLL